MIQHCYKNFFRFFRTPKTANSYTDSSACSYRNFFQFFDYFFYSLKFFSTSIFESHIKSIPDFLILRR